MRCAATPSAPGSASDFEGVVHLTLIDHSGCAAPGRGVLSIATRRAYSPTPTSGRPLPVRGGAARRASGGAVRIDWGRPPSARQGPRPRSADVPGPLPGPHPAEGLGPDGWCGRNAPGRRGADRNLRAVVPGPGQESETWWPAVSGHGERSADAHCCRVSKAWGCEGQRNLKSRL